MSPDPVVHNRAQRTPAVFVPGVIMPVALSYASLLEAIKDEIQPVLKELEVYAGDTPPPDYGLALEVEGLWRTAEAAGLESFHLVGYSGGGAVALAFTAKYPERPRSLALIEPAWIGDDFWTPEEAVEIDRVMALPPEQRMPAFVRFQLRPGVEPPPPPSPPPPWMAKRPAGVEALAGAFKAYHLDRERFRLFRGPVYFAFGNLSHILWERMADTLAGLFPNIRAEVYEGRHHFDPPHRAEPERFAQVLRDLWARSEAVWRQ